MKISQLLLCLALLGCTAATAQTTYLDTEGNTLNRSEFESLRATNQYLGLFDEAKNEKRLIERTANGTIGNREEIQEALEQQTGRQLDDSAFLVIIYYPGKDACNRAGSKDKRWLQAWYGELETRLQEMAGVQPLYIYKDPKGLKKYKGIVDWHADPDGMIEQQFFQHHYPCQSFVVIAPGGEYVSYFGAFEKERVWDAVEGLQAKIDHR